MEILMKNLASSPQDENLYNLLCEFNAKFRDSCEIYVDGACSSKTKKGGWAFIVVYKGSVVAEFSGSEEGTTNNRMELISAINAARYASQLNLQTTIFSDSTYVIKGVTEWVHDWKNKDWKKADGGDVINPDLWKILDESRGAIIWKWVKAHADNTFNNMADQLAQAASK